MYVWSLQTGRLLDVLAGHEAPLSELSFSPSQGVLASASWDGTVKLWDVYKSECIEVKCSKITPVVISLQKYQSFKVDSFNCAA